MMKNKISEYCDIAMVAIAVNEKEKIIEMNKDKTLINGLEIFKDTTSPKEGWDSVFLSREDYLKLLELKELINQTPPLPSEIEEALEWMKTNNVFYQDYNEQAHLQVIHKFNTIKSALVEKDKIINALQARIDKSNVGGKK